MWEDMINMKQPEVWILAIANIRELLLIVIWYDSGITVLFRRKTLLIF